MVLIGRRLSAEEFRLLLADPATADTLLYGDLDDDEAEMPEPELDLEKSWHGVHYLLTGTAWATDDGAGAAILGGDEVGEDGGYGPARILGPERVRAVAASLDALNVETLRARFDPDAMAVADIYPLGWADIADDFDRCLAPYFIQLRDFYRSAASNGQAVLLAIA
ncbi:YfbM family protein [Actinoplanes sp. NPDC049118]|uniref:YfbM family protein n=1 Tax=Actinoplanes sp. NPDC049118 TaxID=3155769 RepID=UPI0033F9CB79